jgi:hypothetical protein
MIGGLDLAKASLEPHELAAFLTGKLKEGFITNQALLDETLERMYLIAAVISGLFGFAYFALLDTCLWVSFAWKRVTPARDPVPKASTILCRISLRLGATGDGRHCTIEAEASMTCT